MISSCSKKLAFIGSHWMGTTVDLFNFSKVFFICRCSKNWQIKCRQSFVYTKQLQKLPGNNIAESVCLSNLEICIKKAEFL